MLTTTRRGSLGSLCAAGAIGVAALVLASASCARTKGGDGNGPSDDGGVPSFVNDDAAIHLCPGAGDHSSVGCEYYAVHMDGTFDAQNGCFAVFVTNASSASAHIDVAFDGQPIDLSRFAKLPNGSGRSIAYDDFDPGVGLTPGQVAILFLAGPPDPGTPGQWDQNNPVPCPVKPALSALTQIRGTGVGRAFRIRTDYPVAAYQMLPYGGGSAAVTGATLLIPTSAFDTNYIATSAYRGPTQGGGAAWAPSLDLVAAEDDTTVTILPNAPIEAGQLVAAAPAHEPVTYKLGAGQVLQLTQGAELTGSPIQSDRPIGMFGGFTCLGIGPQCCCDHAEQQVPAIPQMGSEYVAAGYRARTQYPENRLWRLVGAVNGTKLTYEPSVGGPTTLNLGDVLEFHTDTPFVVSSQDADHPFLLVSFMSSANDLGTASDKQGYGDPDVVRVVPVPQYRSDYVFFTDPTYPETNLVVTRKRDPKTGFADVKLDCAGTLGGWQPLDASDTYEVTRVDLVRHDFQKQGSCDNGRHEMTSSAPFGLTVWGWGTPETSILTGYVSYGYPAGENLGAINHVVVPPK